MFLQICWLWSEQLGCHLGIWHTSRRKQIEVVIYHCITYARIRVSLHVFFIKRSLLDVWQGSEYASVTCKKFEQFLDKCLKRPFSEMLHTYNRDQSISVKYLQLMEMYCRTFIFKKAFNGIPSFYSTWKICMKDFIVWRSCHSSKTLMSNFPAFLLSLLTSGKERDYLGSSNLSFNPQICLTPNFGIRKFDTPTQTTKSSWP